MFGGFDPKEQKHEFLEHKRGLSIVLALALYAGTIVAFQYMPEPKPPAEEEVPVELAPQPEPEEEPDEEMEIEEEEEPEEPPPPPPPNAKPQPKDQKQKPAPKVETPQEVTDQELDESTDAKKDQAGGGWGSGDAKKPGTGTKPDAKPEAKKEEPKEEPKAPPKRDPKKPTTLTRNDKPAKPDPSNPMPKYPSAMQKRGIEGLVIVKLEIDQKGRLRKIKFTKVQNKATKETDKEKANEVMKKEVAKALSRWKFLEPCKHPDGKPFTCVMTQRFPFTLKK